LFRTGDVDAAAATARSTCITADKVTITEEIAEWDYGDYEGLVVEEIVRRRRAKGLDQDHGGRYNIWRDGCEGGE
jgi:probable phosphoglycerate mutase